MAAKGWQRKFEDPIPLPNGDKLITPPAYRPPIILMLSSYVRTLSVNHPANKPKPTRTIFSHRAIGRVCPAAHPFSSGADAPRCSTPA
jgi:hypothetical protein